VRLTHKINKLFRAEFYTRAWRRCQRILHPIPLRPLLQRLDQRELREIQERYKSSTAHFSKYAQIKRWMKLNIKRVQDLKLNRTPPQDILDLGCGGGFFLYICQQLGHRCLGLDIEGCQIFQDLIKLFGIERRVWEIKTFDPLPDLGRKFDLITGFSTSFNCRDDQSLWGPPEWDFFLKDLRKHLQPNGKVFFGLNPKQEGWYYTDELRDFFLSRGATVERERILFTSLGA
jgi:SAM-dependent methyltransferase